MRVAGGKQNGHADSSRGLVKQFDHVVKSVQQVTWAGHKVRTRGQVAQPDHRVGLRGGSPGPTTVLYVLLVFTPVFLEGLDADARNASQPMGLGEDSLR